jgi:ABC-type amino acid transport system permease subunit
LGIIAIAPAVALLLFSWKNIQLFEMWVAVVVGLAMGFFLWEHAKEAGILTGPFKRWLVILSLLTTVVILAIWFYGVYVDSSGGNPESIQTLLVCIMLFIACMAGYMIALCVVAFRAK